MTVAEFLQTKETPPFYKDDDFIYSKKRPA